MTAFWILCSLKNHLALNVDGPTPHWSCLLFSGDKLMFKPFHHLFITSNRFQAAANQFEGKSNQSKVL